MHQIQAPTPFSQSQIWQLQRDYFNEAGIDAWRSGDVPHYITSNPVVGKTYAELVLAFLRDLALQGRSNETVYLLELGAGHGRLCYHFFKHFEKYYQQSAIELPPFCYVLSDFTVANLEFWQDHPRLRPFAEKGWLDFALFDAKTSSTIQLQHKNITIDKHKLDQPLIVIANYFFDTIEQELFFVNNQKMGRCLLGLTCEGDPEKMSPGELIDQLKLQYSYLPVDLSIYADESILADLLAEYLQKLTTSHVLLPSAGIRCLERLRQLSCKGLLLLTADKGQHHLSNLDNTPAPHMATHGSFSLSVNYHAFKHYCHQLGGQACFPRHQQASLDVGCLLMFEQATEFRETLNAYERFVGDFGPDDYFSLKKLFERHFDTLALQDVLAIIRLSGFDARIFDQMLPRLYEILPGASIDERWNLFLIVPRVWDTYYPLGERTDLAFSLGNLLCDLCFYTEALVYYQLSVSIYGEAGSTLCNIALCHCLLGEIDKAETLIELLRTYDPRPFALDAVIEVLEKQER